MGCGDHLSPGLGYDATRSAWGAAAFSLVLSHAICREVLSFAISAAFSEFLIAQRLGCLIHNGPGGLDEGGLQSRQASNDCSGVRQPISGAPPWSFKSMASAYIRKMSRSDRASPGGGTACSDRWTVRSALVNVVVPVRRLYEPSSLFWPEINTRHFGHVTSGVRESLAV